MKVVFQKIRKNFTKFNLHSKKNKEVIVKNVKLSPALLKDAEIEKTLDQARQKLGEKGRLVVRPSGTEPLIRIMAEGEDQRLTEEIVDFVIDALVKHSQIAVA